MMNDLAFLPWVSLIAGFGGSLHCVGMCGGLVTATCQKNTDIAKYQIGRLGGYLLLGFFAGVLGKIFTIQTASPKLTFIPGLILGALFIYWGIQNYRGKKAELPTPKWMSTLYTKLWLRFIHKNPSSYKSLITGFLSILLPCGLLYGVVIGVVAFQHSFYAILSMFFFWLGTVPSMVLAPSIIQRILKPVKLKLPKAYAVSLIMIGLATISFRVVKFQEANANLPKQDIHQKKELHCH